MQSSRSLSNVVQLALLLSAQTPLTAANGWLARSTASHTLCKALSVQSASRVLACIVRPL